VELNVLSEVKDLNQAVDNSDHYLRLPRNATRAIFKYLEHKFWAQTFSGDINMLGEGNFFLCMIFYHPLYICSTT